MNDHIEIPVIDLKLSRTFYEKAFLPAGAERNGARGPRPQYTPNYYAYFVFDPDKHNIETVHNKSENE